MRTVTIRPKFLMKPALIVQIDGEFINLMGKDIKQTLPATPKRPAMEIPVRGAKQEDLLKIMDSPEVYGSFDRILKVNGETEVVSVTNKTK